VHEGDAVDAGQHRLEPQKPAAPGSEVDLGHVPGDHRLRPEADPGEEHLHLLGGRVLGLVEDQEAVVERPAPHVGERRHLDGVAVEQALGALGPEHVVEGVVERSEIGVDLGQHVAGEEPQALARLDRRPGEDDPVDHPRLQRLHGEGDGQVRLAGAGRADPEGDDVAGDGVDVGPLATGLGTNRAAARRAQHLGGHDVRRALVGLDHLDRAADVGGVETLPPAQQEDQLVEEPCHPVGVGAADGDLVASHEDLGVGERRLHEPEQLVAVAEEGHHEAVVGDEDLDLGRGHWCGSQATGSPLPRRPVHRPAAEDVQMEMGHRVLGVLSHVEHEPVTPLGQPLGASHLLGGLEQVGEDVGVARLQRRRRLDVLPRHDEDVVRHRRLDVPEGQGGG
jgi:hypothetical protein